MDSSTSLLLSLSSSILSTEGRKEGLAFSEIITTNFIGLMKKMTSISSKTQVGKLRLRHTSHFQQIPELMLKGGLLLSLGLEKAAALCLAA